MEDKKDGIIIDRGLAKGVKRVHGLNPVLLLEKILRERIQDSQQWMAGVCNMSFWDVLREACLNLTLVGTYINLNKTKVSTFMMLLLRLFQLPKLDDDIVEWLVTGDHGYKYATVLFMVYARVMWEDSKMIYLLLEQKLDDYRKIKVFNGTKFELTTIDQIADDLLNNKPFFGMFLPRLINRWILEESGELDERESKLAEEFERQLEEAEDET